MDYKKEKIDKKMMEIESALQLKNRGRFQILHLSDLMKKEFPDDEWYVEGLLPLDGMTVLSAAPHTYKTYLMLDLSVSVTSQKKFLNNFETKRTAVLIIDEESGYRLLQKRMKQLNTNEHLPIYLMSYEGFEISKKDVEEILEFATKLGIGLVMIDALVRVHSENENDAVAMARMFKKLRVLTKEGISVLIIHHHRKSGGVESGSTAELLRGSSEISAQVDIHLAVFNKGEQLVLKQLKNRYEPLNNPFKIDVILNEDKTILFEYSGVTNEIQNKVCEWETLITNFLESQTVPLNKKKVFESIKKQGINLGYSTFDKALKKLIEKQHIFTTSGKGSEVLCSAKPFNNQASPSFFE